MKNTSIHLFILLISLSLLFCNKRQEHTIVGAGEPMFSIQGTVVDMDNNRPVAGAVLSIEALGLIDTVDAEGNYRFENIKVSTRRLRIEAPQYKDDEISVEFLDYENRDMVRAIPMIKEAVFVWKQELPMENPGGIWCEGDEIYLTAYDDIGGSIYVLNENFAIKRVSQYLVTWFNNTYLATNTIVPVLFPDSSYIEIPVYATITHELAGLLKVGRYFYSTSGAYYSDYRSGIVQGIPHTLFKIDSDSLRIVEQISLTGFSESATAQLRDLTWDGKSMWLCDAVYSTFPKLWQEQLIPQSVLASPVKSPNGIAWDGKYLWIASQDRLYQLDQDLSIRNHYALPYSSKNQNYYINQIVWFDDCIYALNTALQTLLKISVPFEDHL